MPYFPLIVVFCQRYVKSTGIGTLVALMLPYSLTFLVTWTVLLIVYWMSNIPLGLQASYRICTSKRWESFGIYSQKYKEYHRGRQFLPDCENLPSRRQYP